MKKNILEHALFKDLIEFSNDMVWILRIPDMFIEYVNQTTCNEMGYTLEEIQELGMGKLRKSLPDAVSFSEHIEELKQTDQGMTDYALLVRSDGSEFHIEVKARIIEIEGSTYNLAIVRNISDRIEMLKKIEEASKKAQSYLDVSKVIIMALDSNKNVIMINQAGCELLGYEKEELIGENFIAKCIPDSIQEDVNYVADDIITLASTHTGKINEVVTKRGERKIVSWKNSTLFDDAGNPIGILTSGEDITELAYTQKQLLQQTKQAQMGEMMSMIAHQWRQPLATISSILITMQIREELNQLDTEFCLKQIGILSNTVQHLSKTIDDFGNFFKEDKKKSNISLDSMAEAALELNEAIFKNTNISIERDYKYTQEISLYKNEVIQTLMNLFKNALDVFQERQIDEPTIFIKTYRENDNYCLSISDNAGGIAPYILPKVFDPYFTTKGSLNGSGIGLYMSKTIIEDHCGGKLSAENTENGAKFTIIMPIEKI